MTGEYIRDLVRRDQEERGKKRLRDLIEVGWRPGPVSASRHPLWLRGEPQTQRVRMPHSTSTSNASLTSGGRLPSVAASPIAMEARACCGASALASLMP